MKYMPIFMDVQQRPVLIIGGGKVASRKADQISKAGAMLTVIAPQISEKIKAIPGTKVLERPAAASDVNSEYALVIIASNDVETNNLLAEQCSRLNLLFNRCDNFVAGNIITGTTVAKGEIICSTISGGVPEISRWLQSGINELITPQLAQLSALLAELRPAIKAAKKHEQNTAQLIASYVNQTVLDRIAVEGCEKLRQEILQCL